MAIYNVAETTNVSGKCFSMVYGADIENGSVVKMGDIITDKREEYAAGIPAKGDKVYLVANPAWSYKNGTIEQNEDNYINVANKPFRVYGITPVVSGTDELPPAVGDYIGVDGTTVKLKNFGATIPADADNRGFLGKIVDIDNYGCVIPVGTAGTISTVTKMVVIKVIKNENV